jgi:hypothetical protein
MFSYIFQDVLQVPAQVLFFPPKSKNVQSSEINYVFFKYSVVSILFQLHFIC